MILGIETTAHTFGIALVDKGNVLINIKDSYTTEKGGIIPMDAANHHREVADDLYARALEETKVNEGDIKAIALSNSPGLAPCLIAGLEFAKKKAKELEVPIVPVNHCIAHCEIGRITGCKDPVLLYASGANTQVIAFASKKFRVFGETLDLGVGNFIDTVARHAGLGFPGGPKIAKLAEKSEVYMELPYSIKGMDVSFSGIQTKLRQMIDSKKYKLEDLAYSMQETVFAMLVEAAERALAHTGKKELLLGGGVACNSRLQEMCKIMCKERGCKFFCPPMEFLLDNAGMIAYLGEIMFDKGVMINDIDSLDIDPRERTDDVVVSWK